MGASMCCRPPGRWKKPTICLAKAFGHGHQPIRGRNVRYAASADKKLELEEVAGDDMPEDVLNGGYAEAEEFIRALSHGDAPHPSIEEVAPSVTLCLMMAKNMKGTE